VPRSLQEADRDENGEQKMRSEEKKRQEKGKQKKKSIKVRK